MRAWTLVYLSFSFALFLLCVPSVALAATDISSDITSSTEWTLEGSPYVVNVNDGTAEHFLSVGAGATLTIDPGVVVKFGAYDGLAVEGTLQAEGTADAPILFTSLADDAAGGDTNGDGDATVPEDRQWLRLVFNAGSTGSFNHAVVRYGGARLVVFGSFTGIENSGGEVVIDHTTLTHNGHDGLGQYGGHTILSNSFLFDHEVGVTVDGGALEIRDTRIFNNADYGIDHRSGALSITRSEIDHNGIGVSVGGEGSVTVGDSSIHNNADADGFRLGIDNGSGVTADARNTWWGDASGPQNDDTNPSGLGDPVSSGVLFDPWLVSDPFAEPPPDPCATPGACVSNVLFLPGIKGSRLYRPGDGCDAELSSCEDQLWEPGLDEGVFASLLRGAGDDDLRDLFLDAQGASARSDVYVKEREVLDSAGGKGFYASFVADMDALQAEGTIADWEPVAYDWRLSLSDIVEKGRKTGDRISYLEATSTPYIEQELRRLAAASKSGKATIVAHSNGGLVAKALLAKLGGEAAALIDNIIFVGVPQSGAPRTVGALLYGAGEGLPLEQFDFLVSKATAREFSEHSPMAYHLLPSARYFADVYDPVHVVGAFDGTRGFAEERAAYGSTLDTADELYDFLLAREGGREKPGAQNVREANVLDEALIAYARDTHAATDAWMPPEGITLYQIAGWGVDTIAGLRFTELPALTVGPFAALHRSMFGPSFVEDGDGVVPVPSALMTSTTSPNVKRYWMDLREYNKNHINVKHGNLLEVQELRDFINGILNNTESLPEFIKLTQPSSQTTDKKLVFILHSPLALQLQDSSGNTTGLSGDDAVTQDIPGATYGEFGEAQYIIAPAGSYTLSLDGQAEGAFSLEMQEMSGNTVVSSATIADVPATESTLASLTVSGGLETVSSLTVDEDGDGTTDITLAPVAGETVSYEPPVALPSPSGGSAYSSLDPVSSPTVATAVPVAIVSQPATSTTASTTVVQTKKSPVPVVVGVQKKATLRNEEPEEVRNTLDTPQTASVYAASQQPVLKKLGEVFYTSVYRLWRGLQIIFSIK